LSGFVSANNFKGIMEKQQTVARFLKENTITQIYDHTKEDTVMKDIFNLTEEEEWEGF